LKGGQFKILKQNEIEEIHQRAIDVLQQVGCFRDHEGGLAIFEKHGAIVDHSTQIVKIPRNLVEEALRLSPSSSGFRTPPKK
jgi:trimethylamine--corrinoid protein Co-methyltransferase